MNSAWVLLVLLWNMPDSMAESKPKRKLLRQSLNPGRGGAAGVPRPGTGPQKRPNPFQADDNVFACNICNVPHSSVTRLSETIQWDGEDATCQELDALAKSGQISSTQCETAQTLALTNCGCALDNPTPDVCNATITDEEVQWVDAHNERREFWHTYHDAAYSPLCWNETLAAQAQYYADHLADNCLVKHDTSRESPTSYQFCRDAGENLAYDNYAQPRSPADIVFAWSDEEFLDSFPGDGHLTQVLWRPSTLVGCAVAHNPDCYWKNVYICRYVRYGNCNCGGDGCREEMMQESSICGPEQVEKSLDEYVSCFEGWKP